MLILMLILACIMVLTLIALILRKEISLNKRNFLFFLSFILYAIISVLLIKKGIQLTQNPQISCNIKVSTYCLQHVTQNSYYDIQGDEVLIKIKNNIKYLKFNDCTIKQSKNSPKLVETHYILKNKIYRFLFGEIKKTDYCIQIPNSN